MAVLVEEIMNKEVFALRPDDTVADALGYVSALGVTGAPVVDDDGALVGIVALRDLLGDRKGDVIADRMTAPAVSVSQRASITQAGTLMGETSYHRLAVVDDDGRLTGVLSTLDVIRGLLGMPARPPASVPHYDAATGSSWTDDHPLEYERVEAAPAGPGVIALIRGGAGAREDIVWVEAARDVRGRLIDMLSLPDAQTMMLRKVLALKSLRFRAASVEDASTREQVVATLMGQMRKNAGLIR
jgi:predicted transcriptional regulator